MVTIEISLYINVTLTFDFRLDHPVHGGYGWGDLVLQVGGVSDETVKFGNGPCYGATANYPFSYQSEHPTWRGKKVIAKQRKLKSCHEPHKGPNTKTNWPTDHWLQYNLNLNVQINLMPGGITGPPCSWGI
jgi:hypothetical protein